MRPTSKQLAMRDSALAVMLGAVGSPGSDFGADPYSRFGADYGYGRFGADAAPPASAAAANWAQQQATQQRVGLLRPNAMSDVDVQRYCFGLQTTLTLSTPSTFNNISDKPETQFRPQRVTTNVPFPAMVRLSALKVANVGVIVGGEIDAFDFNANGWDQSLDCPTISPANSVSMSGTYTGLLPTPGGYVTATPYEFTLSLKGWATMAGG